MKPITKTICTLIVGLVLLLPISGGAAEKGNAGVQSQQAPTTTGSDKSVEPEKESQPDAQQERVKMPVNMPIYKPPLRGAPAGRVAGGTRGLGEKTPYLCLLVPQHVGLTGNDQPCLYYFLSQPSSYPVELTVMERNAIQPIIETRIPSPKYPGIQAVCLSDYGTRLKKRIQYRWFVALVPDAQHRSRDILAAGAIELVDLPSGLRAKLQGASEENLPYIYAEAGIWYDALTALSALIEKEPQNIGFRKQRASLLEQVGLARAAQYEINGHQGSSE